MTLGLPIIKVVKPAGITAWPAVELEVTSLLVICADGVAVSCGAAITSFLKVALPEASIEATTSADVVAELPQRAN